MILPTGFSWNPFSDLEQLTQSAAGFSATAILNGFSGWLAAGAASLTNHVAALMTTTTTPDLVPGTTGFFLPVQTMLQLTSALVLPLLLVATIGAVLRQDVRRLGRIWGVALPGAMLAAGGAVGLANIALTVTDDLCRAVTGPLNPSLAQAYGNVAKTLTGPVLRSSAFLAALLAAVFVIGGMLLWLELILRSAAVYLAVFFLPLTLAGLVWPATTHWARRMVQLLAAVILSKFVIVVALSLSVRAIAKGGSADDVLAGGAIFLLASFAPFVLLHFAPIVEAGAISHLEGLSRRPLRAAEDLHGRAERAAGSPLRALVAGHGTGAAQGEAPDSQPVAQMVTAVRGGEVDAEYAAATGGSTSAGYDPVTDGQAATDHPAAAYAGSGDPPPSGNGPPAAGALRRGTPTVEPTPRPPAGRVD